MKISRAWLQTYFNDPLPESSVLADALTFHAFEIESVENDILDVKVTPNRGHDCLSHRGIAKEVSAILKLPMNGDPLRTAQTLEPKTDMIQLAIQEPTLCARYVAGYIKDVKVGPSPDWLRESLESIGQRSINNVVDATNYVMFGLGQPLHAFAADQLTAADDQYAIGVRKARAGEKMLALDGKEYTFTDSMLLIVDGHTDMPIGIAGVKGGKPAGITEATTGIIIESANFESVSTRKTAQALKLRTDASSRYEQGISAELSGYGMKAAADLILKIAGGELVGFAESYPSAPEKRIVSATLQKVNTVLGTTLSADDVSDALTRLDLAHAQAGDSFDVHVPIERLDIAIAEDLVEEVGRIIGYDKIPAVELPTIPESPAINAAFAARENVREFLLSRGFSEVFTSVFSEKGERAVLNKVDSVKPFLRADLMNGLREALDKNVRNKDLIGETQIKIFEIGTVWRGAEEIEMLGVAVEQVKKQKSAGAYLGALSEVMGNATVADMPEEVLEIPLLQMVAILPAKTEYDNLAPSSAVRYIPFSKYPFIVRDIAMWVSGETMEDMIREIIREHAGDLLVRLERFDRFEKDGRVSYAFRLVFQSPDRTLFEQDANERTESISTALTAAGYEIR